MYVVAVTVHVKAEHQEAFIQATLDNARHTRQEAGNVRFDVLQAEDDPQALCCMRFITPRPISPAISRPNTICAGKPLWQTGWPNRGRVSSITPFSSVTNPPADTRTASAAGFRVYIIQIAIGPATRSVDIQHLQRIVLRYEPMRRSGR